MAEKEKTGLQAALERWQDNHRLARFNVIKEPIAIQQYDIKMLKSLKGQLLLVSTSKLIDEYDSAYQNPYSYPKNNIISLHFWDKQKLRFGTYKKGIPVGEIVLATGKVGSFRIKNERYEQNLVEAVTTKGLGYLFWRTLVILDSSVD